MRDRPYKVGKGKRKYPEPIFQSGACPLRTNQLRMVLPWSESTPIRKRRPIEKCWETTGVKCRCRKTLAEPSALRPQNRGGLTRTEQVTEHLVPRDPFFCD